MDLNQFAKEVHDNAVKHGWWDEERTFPEIIALCHSELSEALEEYRAERPFVWYKCADPNSDCKNRALEIGYPGKLCLAESCTHQKPEGIAVELADCIIRILDFCGKYGIDIENLLLEKHAFNKTRPYKHGGKIC